jgi:predicted nucleic acid-binding protein
MPLTDFVLDASVLVPCAWKPDAPRVAELIRSLHHNGSRFVVPHLAWMEVRHTLWRFTLTPGEAARHHVAPPRANQFIADHRDAEGMAVALLNEFGPGDSGAETIAETEFERMGWHVSRDLKHPVNDCMYIGIARARNCCVLTLDRKLCAAVQRCFDNGGRDYRQNVRLVDRDAAQLLGYPWMLDERELS